MTHSAWKRERPRDAAQAGLNPDTAAYTKSKPPVRAYMIEHRAAVQQQLVEQETDLSRLPRQAVGECLEGLRRLNLGREQVLARLWEIANLAPEMTRGSITDQVKALSMIVAMESLIPDRRARSSENKSAPPPPTRKSMPPPARPGLPWGLTEPETTPGSAEDAPPAVPIELEEWATRHRASAQHRCQGGSHE